MIGTVEIADLEIRCIVGILERERVQEQTIYIDIEIDCDFAEAERTEDVAHAVDYAAVSSLITEWVQDEKFKLIETMAERACTLIFTKWPIAKRAMVRVKKPEAVDGTRFTAVRVDRTNPAA